MSTFRLFVHHGRPLQSAEEEQELRQLFEKFGRVTSFFTRRGEWRNSQITFASTSDAVKAKQGLDKTRFKEGMTLKIFFTKPSRVVLVRGLPERVSFDNVRREFRGVRFVEREGHDVVAVTFEMISDAQAVVASGKVFQGRVLSFDFGTERRASGRSRSRSPIRRVRPVSRSRSRSRDRSRHRYASPSPRRERSKAESPRSTSLSSSNKIDKKRSRSASSSSSSASSSSSSSLKVSKKSKEGGNEPLASHNLLSNDDVELFAAAVEHRNQGENDDEQGHQDEMIQVRQDANGPCRACGDLLENLKMHVHQHHAESNVAIQKATVKAWFEAHYSRRANNNDPAAGEKPFIVNRSTLLKEINIFLESIEWPTWKTQSPMYKDWFLREVMNLSDDDIKKGRNWSLFYKDAFAPGGKVDKARNKEQTMAEMVAKLRQYLSL